MARKEKKATRVLGGRENTSAFIQYFIFSFLYYLEYLVSSFEKKRLFSIIFIFKIHLGIRKKGSKRRVFVYSISSEGSNVAESLGTISQLISDGYLFTSIAVKGPKGRRQPTDIAAFGPILKL
jgi:hypothetical protein